MDAVEAEELLSALEHGDDAIRYAARIGLERRLLDGDSTWFDDALESLSADSAEGQ